jgi:hypothetical protein
LSLIFFTFVFLFFCRNGKGPMNVPRSNISTTLPLTQTIGRVSRALVAVLVIEKRPFMRYPLFLVGGLSLLRNEKIFMTCLLNVCTIQPVLVNQMLHWKTNTLRQTTPKMIWPKDPSTVPPLPMPPATPSMDSAIIHVYAIPVKTILGERARINVPNAPTPWPIGG